MSLAMAGQSSSVLSLSSPQRRGGGGASPGGGGLVSAESGEGDSRRLQTGGGSGGSAISGGNESEDSSSVTLLLPPSPSSSSSDGSLSTIPERCANDEIAPTRHMSSSEDSSSSCVDAVGDYFGVGFGLVDVVEEVLELEQGSGSGDGYGNDEVDGDKFATDMHIVRLAAAAAAGTKIKANSTSTRRRSNGKVNKALPHGDGAEVRKHSLSSVEGGELDVDAYMAKRQMTPAQERWNAITVIPNAVFCIYFILGGMWLDPQEIQRVTDQGFGSHQEAFSSSSMTSGAHAYLNGLFGDEDGCLKTPPSWFPFYSVPALPPLPAFAVAAAIILHAPFSILYHWKFAHSLPPGAARTNHWSRRLDQSMIHVACACMSYGTSGSLDYFLANILYNADSVYRQFQHKVRPRRNQLRLLFAFLAYTIPILKRGESALFLQLWFVLALAFYFFARYPIGGWSHSMFHIIITFAPPLVLASSCHLESSMEQIRFAASCTVSAATSAAGASS